MFSKVSAVSQFDLSASNSFAMFIIPLSVHWEIPTPECEPELITQGGFTYQETMYIVSLVALCRHWITGILGFIDWKLPFNNIRQLIFF